MTASDGAASETCRAVTRGECTQMTVGYVMDKNIGNTGGLGGIFGEASIPGGIIH